MKWFKIEEFDSPDEVGSGEKRMNLTFLAMLEEAREEAGVPFRITSGYRTKEHNKDVGGSKTSSHLLGLACDISCTTGHERLLILDSLLSVGFTRIGIAKTFIHVDMDNSKINSIWVY